MPKASLIISFYNKIDYLELVLAGLERQSEKRFEIILADDGSNDEVVHKTDELLNKFSFPAIHLWHEDKGFRKNRILNKAIEAASAETLIFIDGDCIPHSKFIEEHLAHSAEGVCYTGRRVNLSEKITESLTPKKVKNGWLERNILPLLFDGAFGQSFDVEKGFYFTPPFLRRIFNKKNRGLLGCNFSLQKKDMLGINGFDERYEAPSVGEDSDIQFRLELKGVQIKSLNNIAVQYHLYHKLQPRPQKNLDLFEKVKKEASAFTKHGINK